MCGDYFFNKLKAKMTDAATRDEKVILDLELMAAVREEMLEVCSTRWA